MRVGGVDSGSLSPCHGSHRCILSAEARHGPRCSPTACAIEVHLRSARLKRRVHTMPLLPPLVANQLVRCSCSWATPFFFACRVWGRDERLSALSRHRTPTRTAPAASRVRVHSARRPASQTSVAPARLDRGESSDARRGESSVPQQSLRDCPAELSFSTTNYM